MKPKDIVQGLSVLLLSLGAADAQLAAAPHTAGEMTFGEPVYKALDAHPVCARSADFNNDGVIDLVVATQNVGTVEIMSGNGDGTFADPVVCLTGSAVSDIAVADCNDDGFLDLAVGHSSGGHFTVITNNGDGTFATPVTYSATQVDMWNRTYQPYCVEWGDFDGDDYPDLMVAVTMQSVDIDAEDKLLLFVNNGDGTLADPDTIPPGNTVGMMDISAGDLDGDGDIDFAVLFLLHGVRVYRNSGGGSFSSTIYSPGTFFQKLVAADFDNDGDLDFASYGVDSDNLDVITLRNDGAGGLSVRSRVGCSQGKAIAAADLDGDSYSDVILADLDVLVYPAGGQADLLNPVSVFSGGGARAVCAADFDGDGDNDVVIGTTVPDAIVTLINTTGETPREGLFAPYQWTGQSAEVFDIVASDLDADSHDDLAFTSYKLIHGVPGAEFLDKISTWVRGGSDDLHAGTGVDWEDFRDWYPDYDNPYFNVCVGDFNGDGVNDIAASEMTWSIFALNQGDGDFAPESVFSYATGKIVACDLNLDGYDDVVIANSQLRVRLNEGGTGFGDEVSYNFSGSAADVQRGDLNNDGQDDIAVASNPLALFFNNGDGTVSTPPVTLPGDATGLCIADLNNDGWLDLAASGKSATASVYLNNGDGTFGAGHDLYPGGRAVDICAIDVDNDGFLDLAVLNYTVYEVMLFMNDGAGDFTLQNSYPVIKSPRALCALDYDLDGDMDLAVACHGTFSFSNENGGILVLLNRLYEDVVAVDPTDVPTLPSGFTLSQNYPNPFNPGTTILFTLSRRAHVDLEVFNILGQRVEALVDGTMEAGEHRVEWDGEGAPSGVYFCRLKAGTFIESRKMVLVK